ncbi:hypothetical protein F0U44_10580 [Nocardioides humilatus]|uniref:TadE-like protein n=1 Tax=Nocardioides humilatus TaxID=2607660 RepID=A0A5B1LF15_9ACTN|nr:hypothetical protein [Nocardioides humilatus]KAA1418914.1 hypothetical protein F0U44_10580 [Nocardioides humilatus]
MRRCDDRGSAVVELVWLGILLLFPLLWIVLTVSEAQQGAFGVTAAARAAGRAYALAPDDTSGRAAAVQVARRALADQGLAEAPMEVRVTCTPYPRDCHSATSVITVTITAEMVLPLLPDFFGSSRPRFELSASHKVPIGRYQEAARG